MEAVTVAQGAPPRQKRRVFLWVFLAIQVIFIIWVIGGIVSAHNGIPAYCHQGNHSQYIGVKGCEQASSVGAGVGVALVVAFWCVVDFLVGGGYIVYRVARRRPLPQ